MKFILALLQLTLMTVIVGVTQTYVTGEFSGVATLSVVLTLVVLSFIPKGIKGVARDTTIDPTYARAALTQALVAVYRERVEVKSFLRSFFPVVNTNSRFVSIEVQRTNEKYAADIIRGTGSNLNQVSKSTLKTFSPPYYDEKIHLNDLEYYDTAMATLNPSLLRNLTDAMVEETIKVVDKIDRSYERQCSQVLTSGIVTFQQHTSVDFKRKAASLVDDNTTYWNNNSNNPLDAFSDAGKFLREHGKIQMGGTGAYVAILGGKAYNDLINNTKFQELGDKKDIKVLDIIPPNMSVLGASYHGRVTADSYSFDLWVYPEIYEESDGTKVPYITETDMIVTSYAPNFQLTYAGVPQLPAGLLPAGQGVTMMKEGFYTLDYPDIPHMNHVRKIMSAGIAVPTAVDQVYTRKVTAAS